MNAVLVNTLIGFLVGVIGTGLGGTIALSLIRPSNRFLGMLLGSTGGLMLAVVTFDLLPEAQAIGGLGIEIAGILLGILLVIFVEGFFPQNNAKSPLRENSHFLKAGILMGMGIALHNLPEGLAVGSGFMLTSEMGMKVAIVIALHNIPEGIAMATPLRLSGFTRLKVILLTLAAGVPTGLGAFAGALLGSVSDMFIALCLSFAGGTMLYITCGELIPSSKTIHNGRASTVGIVGGFILGLIIVNTI